MGLVVWIISAIVLLLAAFALGSTTGRGALGILIDERGRYSLTRFQIVVWTTVLFSLIAALFVLRLRVNAATALDFRIPDQLLLVLGISGGSTVAATTIKISKDAAHPDQVSASNNVDKPRFSQMFLVEEGAMADRIVDIMKYQNFWITILLVISYVILAAGVITSWTDTQPIVGLPGFSEGFIALLAISHVGYLAGKLPTQTGTPAGLTVRGLRENWQPGGVIGAGPAVVPAAVPAAVPPGGGIGAPDPIPARMFVPRNP